MIDHRIPETCAIIPVADSGEKKRIILRCDAAFLPRLSDREGFEELFFKINCYADFLAAYLEDAVGYVAMYANDRENGTAFITLLAVDPAYQNLHLGSRLLDAAIALAAHKGMRRIRLEVKLDNHRAIRLYERKGFRKQEQTPNGTVFLVKQLSE